MHVPPSNAMKTKKADNQETPWYCDGLRFTCARCGDCCRGEEGYVWITADDIVRMADELEMTPEDFFRAYVREVEGAFSLKEMRNGDCILYDEGCRAYKVRPVQCRTFPFWPEYLSSPKAWKRAAIRCPAVDSGKLHRIEDIQRRLNRLDETGW